MKHTHPLLLTVALGVAPGLTAGCGDPAADCDNAYDCGIGSRCDEGRCVARSLQFVSDGAGGYESSWDAVAAADPGALLPSGVNALSGDIGPAKNFLGEKNVTVDVYDDGTCTYILISGDAENGSGYLYVDVMPRVDDLDEGTHGITPGDVAYDGTLVIAHAETDDGEVFDGTASGGKVTLVRHPDGSSDLEVTAVVATADGEETTSTGSFGLLPTTGN